MAKMKAAQVTKAGSAFEIVECEIPHPQPGQVRVRVLACGVCHSDMFTKENLWPGIQYPRVPGHEIAGIVDEIGAGVQGWEKGQRVGVGWHGGHCGYCPACRRGDYILCATGQVPGITSDGGYEQYLLAPAGALALMPDGISPEEAAPLLCAGITTFNALRHSGAGPGDLVAIQGVGGLGHLAIQFANKFGYDVAAISRGSQNTALAKRLGAHHYIDVEAANPAEQLQKLGGARVILATAPSGKAMTSLIDGLGHDGRMVVLGASTEPIEVTPIQLISSRKSIHGWPSGTSADSEDTLRFSVLTGIRPMIEKFSLEQANQAYERMMSGQAEFRVVLTMEA